MLEFILERYNYWIVIVLMMTGLYIVYARGNLVKKVVGLNIFQTSVFIFYITIGKITGGTAPIYIGGELDHGGGHGDDHSSADSAADGALHAPVGDAHGNEIDDGAGVIGDGSLHSKIDNNLSEGATNDLKAALENLEPSEGSALPQLHAEADGAEKIANGALSSSAKDGFEIPEPPASGDASHGETAAQAQDGLHETGDAVTQAIEAAAHHSEIIYSNPLPHVLILTAIVVGVATTAVGLALAVRIQEAYGTIEEDELEAMDNVAEFGATGVSA